VPPALAATVASTFDPLLRVALSRLAKDHANTVFVTHPYALDLIRVDEDGFLAALHAQLTEGRFVPRPARHVGTPKAGWHVRPATVLGIEDELVYHYLTLHCLAEVRATNQWSEGKFRFAYLTAPSPPTGQEWFVRKFTGWKKFSDVSLGLLKQGYPFILLADIAAYYENIDIGRLMLDLGAAGVKDRTTALLSTCLNKWAMPRNRGIPQSLSPSHVFGEFYLDSIDRELDRKQAEHLRYLDDFRVFCQTERDARLSLHLLTNLLRERGLNLQAAKSEVVPNAEATAKIEHAPRLVEQVTERVAKMIAAIPRGSVAMTPEELRDYILEHPQEIEEKTIRETWADFVSGKIEFDKTVFHFLLSRLRDAKLAIAVPAALTIMRDRPEETGAVLDYVANFLDDIDDNTRAAIAAIAVGADTIFEYQRYAILRWFFRQRIKQSDLLAFCRAHATSSSPFQVMRAYILGYLGEHAERPADYELLMRAYAELESDMDRATIICAMRRASPATRNGFYARCKGESPWVDRALAFAKRNATK
jgi:hypothetical protein